MTNLTHFLMVLFGSESRVARGFWEHLHSSLCILLIKGCSSRSLSITGKVVWIAMDFFQKKQKSSEVSHMDKQNSSAWQDVILLLCTAEY